MNECPEAEDKDLVLGICSLKWWSQGDSIYLKCRDSHQLGVQTVLGTGNFLVFKEMLSVCLLCLLLTLVFTEPKMS